MAGSTNGITEIAGVCFYSPLIKCALPDTRYVHGGQCNCYYKARVVANRSCPRPSLRPLTLNIAESSPTLTDELIVVCQWKYTHPITGVAKNVLNRRTQDNIHYLVSKHTPPLPHHHFLVVMDRGFG